MEPWCGDRFGTVVWDDSETGWYNNPAKGTQPGLKNEPANYGENSSNTSMFSFWLDLFFCEPAMTEAVTCDKGSQYSKLEYQ